MRRPRAGLVSLHPGGLGTPLVRHYDRAARCFAGLGLARWPRPRKRGPGTDIAAMERRAAFASFAKATHASQGVTIEWMRRVALHPLGLAGERLCLPRKREEGRRPRAIKEQGR